MSTVAPASPRVSSPPGWWWIALATLAAMHAGVAWTAAREKGPSFDEIYHVTGGYLYNRLGDFRIHTDNGVLPQRLHGLGAGRGGASLPALEDNPDWRVADNSRIAYQFFHRAGNDADRLLRGARSVALGFGAGLVVLCGVVAARLASPGAGLVAAALAAFSPSLLAHGVMATTDAPAALLLPASAVAFGWQLARPGWPRGLASAVIFGLACVTKYSAALLLPVFVLLVLLRPAGPGMARAPLSQAAGWLAVHLAVAWLVVWATFVFRFAMAAPDVPPLADAGATWQGLQERAGWQGPLIGFLREHRIVPEGWLFGYARTYVGTLFRSAFLAGEYSETGWRMYFPLAFLWKSTPAELVAVVLALVAAARGRARAGKWMPRLAPLLIFAVVYGMFSITSRINIGHRHLLPLYPVLFILGGWAAATWWPHRRVFAASAIILAGMQIAAAAFAHPHHLAYFNLVAGGPGHGWRLLSDSSVDWGQDLPALKRWLERNNSGAEAARVHLAYFGSDEPAYRGLDVVRLPFSNDFRFPQRWYEPQAGLYCISATILQDVYGPVRNQWTAGHEREYRELQRLEPQFKAFLTDSAARAELVAHVPADKWEAGWVRYDRLRLARLCFALRAREPDASVAHSILIYRVTSEQLSAMLR